MNVVPPIKLNETGDSPDTNHDQCVESVAMDRDGQPPKSHNSTGRWPRILWRTPHELNNLMY
ncbi:hypothetical protein HFX_2134 [Haloferax mediterranei ATCC 33500]|uniref:Uncharacterized protein n=1 Tax=Haloferax mediterranei (strain ATCC 33500 / DSM 1411 / JCM 8866 / NBRC 14739 / NCIMB 2177 / R-4) TaxID=523841 RepID=I3R6G4_HALMT|nr:hypothetical protein HFX_2134 [Haloferax mediterranei ATCC 33500]